MKKFEDGETFTHKHINDILKELEHRMSSGDLIKMYETVVKELYSNRELNEFEVTRVKEIEFIISYLQAEEIANEFQDEDRDAKQN